ncbi:MAG: SsrA-binding protein SmpB [Anaerolineales bacterium]|nr:SsrA-binding protein SmpB [Anaerolineales bacterium]
MPTSGEKTVAKNRKAGRDYFLEDRLEAGIVLFGTEIKSIRASQVSLSEAYVKVERGEAWLVNAYIAPYDPASQFNHDPRRIRKLLLHRREINRLEEKVKQRGYTLVPTRMYMKQHRAKLEFALARGKRKYDKRQELAKKDAQREMDRTLSRKNR